eukprot:365942-Chlamydomonas_euryale.AAC.47
MNGSRLRCQSDAVGATSTGPVFQTAQISGISLVERDVYNLRAKALLQVCGLYDVPRPAHIRPVSRWSLASTLEERLVLLAD